MESAPRRENAAAAIPVSLEFSPMRCPRAPLLLICISLVSLAHPAAATPLPDGTLDYRLALDANAAVSARAAAAQATSTEDEADATAASDDAPSFLPDAGDRQVDWQRWIEAGGRCATVDFGPPDLPRAPRKGQLVTTEASINIPVIFHVIYKEVITNGVTVRTGYVSKTQIDAQMSVLNAAYASVGVSFTLRSIERVLNNTWFGMSMGSQAEQSAKAALAVDPVHVLNIYTAGPANNILGWAYFPWSYAESNRMHGLVVLHSTLPGGSAKPYNKGDTATHEIGHYLGLYHTFQGGCLAPGDYVSDTPEESSPAYGCPLTRNTCPTAGLDPVVNFMDYSDDACMNSFTSGQVTRMKWAIATYKKGFTPATALVAPAPADDLQGARGGVLASAPNPFNPTTVLSFRLPAPAHVSLHIYDVAGRAVAQLADEDMDAGDHQVVLEGRKLAGGVYFAVLNAGDVQERTRLVLLK
jgi:hypothetical protein